MTANGIETDAILNIHYKVHFEDHDRLDVIGGAIEDLLEDAGEARGAREEDGWMNEVQIHDIGQVDRWVKRVGNLLRRKKASAGTVIEVVMRFRASKILRRLGLHDKEGR